MFLPFPRIESPRAKKKLTTFKIKIISCTKIKINDHCGGGGRGGNKGAPHVPPQNNLKNCKMQQNTKIEAPSQIF
jgi:hypothetical protein